MDKVTLLKNTDIYRTIESDIEGFVREKLCDFVPDDIGEKTIHDSVWGSVEYAEWEMQLIDSPILQRLREIHQVGLSYLTYPAARHSRFEHSLGVAAAAKKMCDRINSHKDSCFIPAEIRNIIVLSAILHDVGHCFFSHLSESIYSRLPDFKRLKAAFKECLAADPKPHEIMSFIIVNSGAFQSFFFEHIDYPDKELYRDTLFSDAGSMIIGQNVIRDGKMRSYQTAIINGSFDADKLDYLRRDAMTAGLALQYDVERLFTRLRIVSLNNEKEGCVEERLVILENSVTAFEELAFCKIMLFSHLYRHQKVLITEEVIKDYSEGLLRLSILSKLSDFLKTSDFEVLKLAGLQKGVNPFPQYIEDWDLSELVERVRMRRLPKRCLTLSLHDIDFNKNVKPILGMSYDELFSIRKQIYEGIREVYISKKREVDFAPFDIYIVFPSEIQYGSPSEEVVLLRNKAHASNSLTTVGDNIRLDDWAERLCFNKWRGYVYVTEKIDPEIAADAARAVLEGSNNGR